MVSSVGAEVSCALDGTSGQPEASMCHLNHMKQASTQKEFILDKETRAEQGKNLT